MTDFKDMDEMAAAAAGGGGDDSEDEEGQEEGIGGNIAGLS